VATTAPPATSSTGPPACCWGGRRTTVSPATGPSRGEWADLLNPLPKFVVSRTLQEPLEWNATLLEGDASAAVSRLKEEQDGDLLLIGCGELARHLLEQGLVDELRFWLHPAVEGTGARPYEGSRAAMRLLESTSFDSGVMRLRYAPVV